MCRHHGQGQQEAALGELAVLERWLGKKPREVALVSARVSTGIQAGAGPKVHHRVKGWQQGTQGRFSVVEGHDTAGTWRGKGGLSG